MNDNLVPREDTVMVAIDKKARKREFRERCQEMQKRKMAADYWEQLSLVPDKVCLKLRDKMAEIGFLAVSETLEEIRQHKIKSKTNN
jgi:hypothetical protein